MALFKGFGCAGTSYISRAHNAGSRVYIHSIGDGGIDVALEAIEEAQRQNSISDMRQRIEHNSCCTTAQLRQIKELGVTQSSSTGYMYGIDDDYI